MMRIAALALVMLSVAPAVALADDEPRRPHLSRGLAITFGAGRSEGATGAAVALRPELIVRASGSGSVGFGIHGLVGTIPGGRPVVAGGGVDLVLPLVSGASSHNPGLVLQPAVGLYAGDGVLFAVGGLLGGRWPEPKIAGSELAYGLRCDVWFDGTTRDVRSVTISLQVDLAAFAVLLYFL